MSDSLPVPAAPMGLRLMFRAARGFLVEELGEAEARAVVEETRRLLPGLLGTLPETGDKVEARRLLMATAGMAAFARAMRGRGHPVEQTGRLLYEGAHRALSRIPGPVRRLYAWWFFRPPVYRQLVASILGGERPGDFQGRLVPGDGDFDFGVDYSHCALRAWLLSQGEGEIAPFVCQLDYAQSEVLGLGLHRNGTLSQGASHCDFRWKNGRATQVPPRWPRSG